MLKVVEVVDTDELSTDIVSVGSKVRILDMDMDEEEEYQIVGSAEADPMENRISDESPMGKGLIGGRINEEIDIEIPAGMMRLKILEISNKNGRQTKGNASAFPFISQN